MSTNGKTLIFRAAKLKGFTVVESDNVKINNEHIRPGKKNVGSGQLIFENWSGGPVKLFFFIEPQPEFSTQFSEAKVLNDHKDDPV